MQLLFYARLDGVEFFVGGLLECGVGCLAVDGVNHHLTGGNGAHGIEPGIDIGVGGVVDAGSFQKHGLYDGVSMEGSHTLNDFFHVVPLPAGTVYLIYKVGVDGVEFQNVVVDFHQGSVYLRTVKQSGIAEHADLCLWEILVAQKQRVVDDLWELRVARGLSVAGEGEYVGCRTVLQHILQSRLERCCHLIASGHLLVRTMVGIEAAFAVDTVKGTNLAVGRQQVDAQRYTQSPTVYGSENGRWIDNCTHTACKFTLFFCDSKKNQ